MSHSFTSEVKKSKCFVKTDNIWKYVIIWYSFQSIYYLLSEIKDLIIIDSGRSQGDDEAVVVA